MAKDKTAYVCTNCGYDSPKWIGKCPACGEWNTFKEQRVAPSSGFTPTSLSSTATHSKPVSLRSIEGGEEPRIDTGDEEHASFFFFVHGRIEGFLYVIGFAYLHAVDF